MALFYLDAVASDSPIGIDFDGSENGILLIAYFV